MADTTDPVVAEQLNMVIAMANTDSNLALAWQAYKDGDIDSFRSYVLASDFYRNNNATSRARMTAKTNQPGVYANDLNAYTSQAKVRLAQKGVAWDSTIEAYATDAYNRGLTDAQLDNLIVTSGKVAKYGGDTLNQISSLQTYANQFGMSYDKTFWDNYSQQIFSGTTTMADIEGKIRTDAASAFPAYADQINKGVSVDALASAYKASMANILEVDADSVNYNDPTLRKALQYIGTDGKPATKPLWQFESELRQDARWQYTNNARDTIDSLSLKVIRDWGLG
jgi:hypothetical protein